MNKWIVVGMSACPLATLWIRALFFPIYRLIELQCMTLGFFSRILRFHVPFIFFSFSAWTLSLKLVQLFVICVYGTDSQCVIDFSIIICALLPEHNESMVWHSDQYRGWRRSDKITDLLNSSHLWLHWILKLSNIEKWLTENYLKRWLYKEAMIFLLFCQRRFALMISTI